MLFKKYICNINIFSWIQLRAVFRFRKYTEDSACKPDEMHISPIENLSTSLNLNNMLLYPSDFRGMFVTNVLVHAVETIPLPNPPMSKYVNAEYRINRNSKVATYSLLSAT